MVRVNLTYKIDKNTQSSVKSSVNPSATYSTITSNTFLQPGNPKEWFTV